MNKESGRVYGVKDLASVDGTLGFIVYFWVGFGGVIGEIVRSWAPKVAELAL